MSAFVNKDMLVIMCINDRPRTIPGALVLKYPSRQEVFFLPTWPPRMTQLKLDARKCPR